MSRSVFLVVVAGAMAFAQSWNRFRGPNGTGVDDAANPPVEFSQSRNLLWRTVLEPGLSSPVLSGGRVFLTALEQDQFITYAINAANGAIVWKRGLPRPRREALHKLNHPASPSVAAGEGVIAAFFPDFGLAAYTVDGVELWRRPLGPFNNLYGMGASPILAQGKLILVCDQSRGSFVAAFDLGTGREIWRRARPEAISGHSTPILFHPPGGALQVVAPGSFRMDAYDAATGEPVWWVQGLPSEMKSVPVLDGGAIYVHGFNTPEHDAGRLPAIPPFDEALAAHDKDKDGRLAKDETPSPHSARYFAFLDLNSDARLDRAEWDQYARTMRAENAVLSFRAGGTGDVTASALRWKFHRSIPQLPSPLIYQGVVYMINEGGILTTLEASTGRLLKQARLRAAADNYYASPVAADGRVYIASHNGVISVLEAGPDQRVLASNDLAEEILTTPALDGSRLLVRTRAALYCFGTRSAD